jgi:hypothetical protein
VAALFFGSLDGVTWQDYEPGLQESLIDLHSRVHHAVYRAKPSRRVYITKADGRQRPLGIAALEDKIVQQAVVTILNQVYEEDFLGFSYGFRPGSSQHQALDALSYCSKDVRRACPMEFRQQRLNLVPLPVRQHRAVSWHSKFLLPPYRPMQTASPSTALDSESG